MDMIITNSKNVQKRLKDFTGFDSKIIYPPTDTSRFTPVEGWRLKVEGSKPELIENLKTWKLENYFLSFARLSPPKRVDMIVDAFLGMPEEKLILTYGKNDPMKDDIFSKIRESKNITALESPDDESLISLIQWATATIYIPVDEDFGMSPVESMACGTPVIGVDEWWLRETIIDGKTGKLIEIINYKWWVINLQKVIQDVPKEDWKQMRDSCVWRAQDFSLEKFQERLQSLLTINN